MATETGGANGGATRARQGDDQAQPSERVHMQEEEEEIDIEGEKDEDSGDEEEEEEEDEDTAPAASIAGKKDGKRGRKDQFSGQPLEFLTSILPEFRQVRAYKGQGSRRRHTQFWATAKPAFWAKFDWTAFLVESNMLETKAQVVKRINKAMLAWCRWKTRPGAVGGGNPWARVLRSLCIPQGNAPRKPPAWQMWHRAHAAAVKEAAGPDAKIWERNKLAAELYREEDEEVKAQMEQLAQEEHQAALKTYNDAKTGDPSPDAEEQMKARRRLAPVIKPLLRLIGQYTGFTCLTLVGAAPRGDDDGYDFCAVHHGETKETFPKNFGTFDPAAFQAWSQVFCTFVGATKETDGPRLASTDTCAEPSVNPLADETLHTIPPSTPPPDAPTVDEDPELEFTEEQAQSPFVQDKSDFKSLYTVTKRLRGAERQAEIARLASLDAITLGDEEFSVKLILVEAERQVELGISSPQTSRARAPPTEAQPSRPPGAKKQPKPMPKPRRRGKKSAKSANGTPGLQDEPEGQTNPSSPESSQATPQTPAVASQKLPQPPPNPVSRQQSPVVQAQISSALPQGPHAPSQRSPSVPPPTTAAPPQDAVSPPPPVSLSPPVAPQTQSTSSITDSAAQPTPDDALATPPSPPVLSPPPAVPLVPGASEGASDIGSTGVAVDLSGAPEWLSTQHAKFAAVLAPKGAQDTWQAVLAQWVALERALSFANPRSGIPKGSRPEEIGTWIQYARNGLVVVKNRENFAHKWNTWWSEINPTWRERVDGRLVTGGEGDWSCLAKSGSNGFLSIVAVLVALQDAVDCEKWVAEVADVAWVLGEVTRFVGQRHAEQTPSKRSAEDLTDTTTTSRKRSKRS